MKFGIKNVFFQILAPIFLSLAAISPLQAGRDVLYVEFDDHQKIAYSHHTLSFEKPIPLPDNFSMELSQIQYGSVLINRLIPMKTLILQLYEMPGVRGAFLEEEHLSPDEQCEREIQRFNQIVIDDLSLSSKVKFFRNHLFALHCIQRKGARVAQENIPGTQCDLGIILANLSDDLPVDQAIPLLRESIDLFVESGTEIAMQNLPATYCNLGITLEIFSNSFSETKAIPLLKESMESYISSGIEEAKERLPTVQASLGIAMVNASGELPLDKKISYLQEAVRLLTESVKADNARAKKNLPKAQEILRNVLKHSSRMN